VQIGKFINIPKLINLARVQIKLSCSPTLLHLSKIGPYAQLIRKY
jgi:hypothetical protein